MVATNNLWNHKGSEEVSFVDLENYGKPEQTKTYEPLSHHEFVFNTHNLGQEVLGTRGFSLASEKYLVSKDRAKMFFMLGYQNGVNGMQMVAAGRNSTDKSMSVCLSIGSAGRVVVCDNLVVSGEIVVFRKHTGNLFQYLREKLVLGFHEATGKWRDLNHDVTQLKEVAVDEKDAHHFLVEAGRKKVIGKSDFFQALQEYHEPRHEEFREPNLWSVYNAVTEALKVGPLNTTLERHRAFHDFARDFAGQKQYDAQLTMADGEETQQREEQR